MASAGYMRMHLVPYSTDQETPLCDGSFSENATAKCTSLKRGSESVEDSDEDYYSSQEYIEGSNYPKRRRQYFDLDMPPTKPWRGPPLHDPELYETIQRLGKMSGAYMGAGANVVLKFEPFGSPSPSPMEDEANVKRNSVHENSRDMASRREQGMSGRAESLQPPPFSPLTPRSEQTEETSVEELARRGVQALYASIRAAQGKDAQGERIHEDGVQEMEVEQPHDQVTEGQTGGKKLPELSALQEEMERDVSAHARSVSGQSTIPEETEERSSPPVAPGPRRGKKDLGQPPITEAASEKPDTSSSKPTASQGNASKTSGYDSDFLTGRERTPSRPPPSVPPSPTEGMKRIGRVRLYAAFPRVMNFRRIRTWAGRRVKAPSIRKVHTSANLLPRPCLTRPGRRDVKFFREPFPVSESPSVASLQPVPPDPYAHLFPDRDIPIPSIEDPTPVPEAQAPVSAPRGGAPRRARIRIGPPRGRSNRQRIPPASEAHQPSGLANEASQPTTAAAAPDAPTLALGTAAAAPSGHLAGAPAARGVPRRRARTRPGPPPRGRIRQPDIAPRAEALSESATVGPSVTGETRSLPRVQAPGEAEEQIQPATESTAQPPATVPGTGDARTTIRANTAARRAPPQNQPSHEGRLEEPNQNQNEGQERTAAPVPRQGRGAAKATATAPLPRPEGRVTRAAARAAAAAAQAAEAAANAPTEDIQEEEEEEETQPGPARAPVKKGRGGKAASAVAAKGKATAKPAGRKRPAAKSLKAVKVEEVDDEDESEVEESDEEQVEVAPVPKGKKTAKGVSKASGTSTAKKSGTGKRAAPKKGGRKK
ncbi:predicted protein [Uncinocarpus reesii 1704]|uniref:Uncharacterized protein n=1 Tax=Uncinocarpus reesii (strain UAMH 1704) TaxID=336963 RepID=C4JWC2_UNCRE|nr:uncharacterized protein UREG_06864 [Uncinocarpus reesii 1704]EEP81999.1 predicted protein [Uncinocarpus reesii 1704]